MYYKNILKHIMIIEVCNVGAFVMKVALMVDMKNISKEISKTTEIHVFEVDKAKIKSRVKIDTTSGGGYEGLLYILYNEGVETVLCGDLKENERKDFLNYGLKVFAGAKGSPIKTLNAYIRYMNNQR